MTNMAIDQTARPYLRNVIWDAAAKAAETDDRVRVAVEAMGFLGFHALVDGICESLLADAATVRSMIDSARRPT